MGIRKLRWYAVCDAAGCEREYEWTYERPGDLLEPLEKDGWEVTRADGKRLVLCPDHKAATA
jgi:hypothetical protein